MFFKQNMGLPFMAAVAGGMFVLLAAEWRRTRSFRAALRSQAALVLAGMVIALLIGAGLIAATAGLGNYFHWTVQFAAQRRLPGLASMLSVYQQPSFAWTLPTIAAGLVLCHTRFIARLWVRIAALCLLVAPFAGSLIYLLIDDVADERADNLLALWPLLLLAALVAAAVRIAAGRHARPDDSFFRAGCHSWHVTVAATLGIDVRALAFADGVGGLLGRHSAGGGPVRWRSAPRPPSPRHF